MYIYIKFLCINGLQFITIILFTRMWDGDIYRLHGLFTARKVVDKQISRGSE